LALGVILRPKIEALARTAIKETCITIVKHIEKREKYDSCNVVETTYRNIKNTKQSENYPPNKNNTHDTHTI
jgi:hypothetical protein